jgi:hypothetical protein
LIVFQAQLNNFPHSFHKSVQVFRLCVATSQGWNASDVVVVFVSFDNNCEFQVGFHVLILAWQRKAWDELKTFLKFAAKCRFLAALGMTICLFWFSCLQTPLWK